MSSAMAPSAIIISGRTGSKAGICAGSFIGVLSLRRQRGGLGEPERLLVVLQQRLYGSGGHVEHGLRVDAEKDRQDHQRCQHDDLAPVEIYDSGESGPQL